MKLKRTTLKPSDSVHQQLSMYALAAGAAGVGMLALTQPAEAKIIYHPVDVGIGTGTTYHLDVNQDGVADFSLNASEGTFLCHATHNFPARWYQLNVTALHRNGVAGSLPSALDMGVKIGRGYENFYGGRGTMAYRQHGAPYCFDGRGYWIESQDKYLGLRFRIQGKVHYGWARLNTSYGVISTHTARLTGYAFETIPNKPIIAGRTKGQEDEFTEDPSLESPADLGPGAFVTDPIPDTSQAASLGMLAHGAQGVPLWRRKESILEAKLKGSSL